MKAWQVTASGEPAAVLHLAERERPVPGPGEALVRVAAVGVGMPDVMMCRGTYAFSPPQPFVPGQEIVGEISAVGAGCALKPGQRVMGVTAFYSGHGGFAEYCLAPDYSLYPVPTGMADTEAAAFSIPFHTAWVGLCARGTLQPGETLLVHGAAGGTGAAAIGLARALGATVIAVAGGPRKAQFCRDLGADHVVDHTATDFVEAVRDLTAGRGADVIYDPVGGECFERSLHCIAGGGRLLAVGYASGRWGAADSQRLVMRNCAALGVFVGAHPYAEMLQYHAALTQLWQDRKLRVTPAEVVPFTAIGERVAALGARTVAGKVVALCQPPEQ
ncbi:MAG: NADPH:quinone oxidoreductase family protein [Halioglobus sp.]